MAIAVSTTLFQYLFRTGMHKVLGASQDADEVIMSDSLLMQRPGQLVRHNNSELI
jgi:hypothetical protein